MLDTFLNAASARLCSKISHIYCWINQIQSLDLTRLRKYLEYLTENRKKKMFTAFGFKGFSFKVSPFLILKSVMACLKSLPETCEG